MIRRLPVFAAVAVALAGSACGDSGGAKTAATSAPSTIAPGVTIPVAQLQASASTITDHLIAHKWDEVVLKFNDSMRAGLSAQGLKTAWAQVEAEYGAYKSRSATAQARPPDNAQVTFDTPLLFAKAPAKSRISFDDNGLVAGLYILQLNVP